MSIFLTIGITSYNRVHELKRCLESVKTNYPDRIEILVSEDHSPRCNEIHEVVVAYNDCHHSKVRFHSNPVNLGYDANLKKIIELAQGEYVFLLSDDDYLCKGAIDRVLKVLRTQKPGLLYGSYVVEETNEYGRSYEKNRIIGKSAYYAAHHIYDSILFSGLVLKKEIVEKLDAKPFLNKNYFQVYMFLYTMCYYGGIYVRFPTVVCVGDGENGFGKSESSKYNPVLANRESVFSLLEFHKGLIFVIKQFDKDYNQKIFLTFEWEYNLHSITGLSLAESNGNYVLRKYWKKMNELDIHINMVAKSYYGLLKILGQKRTLFLLHIPRKMLNFIRYKV